MPSATVRPESRSIGASSDSMCSWWRSSRSTSATGLPSRCATSSSDGSCAAGGRVRLEVAQRAQHDVQLLHDVRGQPDRARLVHDRALDRLPDPPRRVGREAEAALGIELLERVDQAEVAFLDQVRQRDAAVRVVPRDADDQPQVALDHRLPRGEVAGAHRARERQLLVGRQQRVLADVVQVELRDVGDEVAGEPAGGLVERQVGRDSGPARAPRSGDGASGSCCARGSRVMPGSGPRGVAPYAGGR